jgi:hypothetical protein
MNSQTGSDRDEDLVQWWRKSLGINIGHLRLVSKQEQWIYLQGWRRIYAKTLYDKTGRWIFHGFDWHVMSYGYAVHVSGTKAEQCYLDIVYDKSYLVYLEHCSIPMCEVTYAPLPLLESLYGLRAPEGGLCDTYLFPPDCSWTFVVTHEPDIGPFFSRRDWQTTNN